MDCYSKKYNHIIKKINLGIEILRMILCFWVISFHCSGNGKNYKILKTFFHVPTFMMISSYFSYYNFTTNNIIKIKSRIERLIIPYIISPIIHIGIECLFQIKIKMKFYINKLIFQYIFGYSLLIHLWYVQTLLFFTIFFEIIFLFFKEKFLLILALIAIISYWLQYSEINYNIFINYTPKISQLSRIIEMLPIAITGINLCFMDLLNILKIHYKKSIFFSIIIFYFIYNYNIFGEFKHYQPFSGIKQNIAALCLFISFSLIPFNKINNEFFFIIFRQISSYTGGIYYFHLTINDFLIRIFKHKLKSFFKCYIIYIFGYLISFIGTKIFRKNKFKYLFN